MLQTIEKVGLRWLLRFRKLDMTQPEQRSELDYLIYNDPLGYANLILNGDPEEYLKNVAGGHGIKS